MYLKLLDARVLEQEVQDFLASHTYFFNSIFRIHGASPVYQRVKLGHNFEVDFAFFEDSSDGVEWRFVEIEAPTKRMFTDSGRPTHDFTHAQQQIRDWHSWVHENLDYARKLMPHIEYPMCYLFIGRREQLTELTRKALKRIKYELRAVMRIHTLDQLADSAASAMSMVGSDGGTWPVPMKAFSHAELSSKQPEYTFNWLTEPWVADATRRYASDRLSRRHLGTDIEHSE